MTTYDIGDRVRLSAVFTDLAGAAANPNPAPVATVRTPGGTTVTPSVANDSTGNYHADVDVDRPGEWSFRWIATGTLIATEAGSFYVRKS